MIFLIFFSKFVWLILTASKRGRYLALGQVISVILQTQISRKKKWHDSNALRPNYTGKKWQWQLTR